jgi:type II secretory pathway pseudopilin PulG
MGMTLFSRKSRNLPRGEAGYILLTMLLTVSLMTIAAMAVLPDMIFQLKRDQEQEMIHRGVQYTRAIRNYYRKLGRYPTSLSDLDNTNNLRFLRKHYKDPLTGKDFKLLHFGDPGLQLGGSFGGGTIPGATPASALNGSNGSPFGNSFGSSNGSSFGNSSLGGSSSGNNGVNSNGVFSQSSFGGNSNSGFGQNGGNSSNGFGQTSNSQNSSAQATNSSSGSSSSGSTASQDAGNDQEDADSNGKVFGGGPIVGVASISKKKTIRIYNKKTKYNEWQFIYDPTADRGGLITTPYQSPLQNFGGQSLQPGQNGSQAGTSNSPFGNSSGSSFGQSSGFGQSSFGGSSFGQSSGFGNNSNSSSSSSNSQQQ